MKKAIHHQEIHRQEINHLEAKRGVVLFNHADFFEAHEVLEDLWRALSRGSPMKKHAQGLVQLAVAFHHESRGNFEGARSVLERAVRNLKGAEESFPDLDLDELRGQLAQWQDCLALDCLALDLHGRGARASITAKHPPLPKIRLRRAHR